jgi:multidrug resistance efflux pump
MVTIANIKSFAKKQLANLQKRHDRLEQEAVKVAQERMARARTDHERKMVREKLSQEKARLRKELSEAKTATNKAMDAAEKARKESGDLTASEKLWKFSGEMRKTVHDLQRWGEGKPRRKRKTTVKRVVKRTTTKKRAKR